MSSKRKNPKNGPKLQRDQPPRTGSWMPDDLAEKICQLKLRPPSLWPVFLAVVFTAQRYGGPNAFMSEAQVAEMTGLSLRTVKNALRRLIHLGSLTRPTRYRHLRVSLAAGRTSDRGVDKLAPEGREMNESRGATLLAPPKCKLTCTSPTSLLSFIKDTSNGTFSAKQLQFIVDVLTESTDLLGSDATALALVDRHTAELGLTPGTTYEQAFIKIAASGDGRQARDFTRAVLALRNDPRVQGEALL